ncbi:MAG: NUDIX hydrolase [Lachnospiraceae bacterium]|nr:NUDIX hydrolase [Lachnospiraceae bacterium]
MVQNIKRVKRELVREGVIVNMYTDFMEMPDGRIAEWDFIEHKKGAAAVVAVLPDGNILMVRQYRNALDRVTLEIPAGARDSVTEDTAICAKRELEEETGYTCGKLEKLLSLKSTVAFCNEFIDVYLATELTPGKQHLDEDEFIDIEACELSGLCEKIYAGEIQDAKTVAAILAYANRLKEENGTVISKHKSEK